MHYLNMRMVSSDKYSSDDSGITVSAEDLCRTLLEMPPPPLPPLCKYTEFPATRTENLSSCKTLDRSHLLIEAEDFLV